MVLMYNRGFWQDFWVTLHPTRALIFYSWVVCGSFMVPIIYYDRLILSIIAVFFYLQLAAYGADEFDRHCDTDLSERFLWFRVLVGVSVSCVIGVYLSIVVVWWLIFLFVFGGIVLLGYNFSTLTFHSRLVFGCMWGLYPVITHYYLHTLEIPPLHVWVFGIFAMAFSYSHIIKYGNWRCRVKKCKDLGMETKMFRDCHGQYCWVRRKEIPKEVHWLQKRICNFDTVMAVVLAIFVVAMYYGRI